MQRTSYPGVYRTAGGRYRVVVTYPGGQKWATADGLKAARTLQAQIRDKLDTGWRPGTATVAGYAERWLEQLSEPKSWRPPRRPNTILRYRQVLELHVLPVLGTRKLSDVDGLAVKELRRRVPPSMARYVLTVLASMYREAIEDDAATHNPIRGLLPARPEHPEARSLSPTEFRRLVDVIRGHRLEGGVMLGLSGLRAGEAAASTWRDVDLDAGRIRVARQFVGDLKAGQPREFQLSDFAVASLKRHRLAQAEYFLGLGARPDDETTIQTTIYGTPFHPGKLGKAFSKFTKANGFDATFHTLRHTFATLQLTAGVDIRTVSYRLGHASPATTLSIYSHVTKESDQRAADSLDAVLERG